MDRSKLEIINSKWDLVLEDDEGDLFVNRAAMMAYVGYVDQHNKSENSSTKIVWGVINKLIEFLKKPIQLTKWQFDLLYERGVEQEELLKYNEKFLVPRELITKVGGLYAK